MPYTFGLMFSIFQFDQEEFLLNDFANHISSS